MILNLYGIAKEKIEIKDLKNLPSFSDSLPKGWTYADTDSVCEGSLTSKMSPAEMERLKEMVNRDYGLRKDQTKN